MPTPPVLTPNDPQEPNVVRVSISEAARLFGVNPRTVRRAVTEGHVRYVVVRGRYALNFESLIRWSQDRATVRNKRDTQGIGQWVDQWKIRNPKFSPRPPQTTTAEIA